MLSMSGCAARDEQARRIGALVGLDVEHGAVRSDGEGSGSVSVFEVTFTGEQADDVEEQIADTPSWHTLPLATALEAALYGPAGMALALLDDAQDGFVRIEQGWWYFENHAQNSGGTAADGGPADQAGAESGGINPENAAITQAFVNASTVGLHLTIGLYDSQAHALFVYTLDSDR